MVQFFVIMALVMTLVSIVNRQFPIEKKVVLLHRLLHCVMNREILRIALPAIVANITIPLLGLLDTAIAGHLGNATMIGAIAVGSMLFNFVYWNFGFLRMGTSGMTAQAYGSGVQAAQARILQQSSVLALAIALTIVVLQWPIRWLGFTVIGPSEDVCQLAYTYFNIVVWGAPPTLMMMSIKGWLLGMQDSKGAMYVSIVVNVINIVASLAAVYVLHMGFVGIAIGTLLAQWLGLGYALWLLRRKFWKIIAMIDWSKTLHLRGSGRFFKVSADIFVRSTLLMLANLFLVAVGARSGDLILAVNALLQQLNSLFAYFMDGIAFAGEALVGKYFGANNSDRLRLCVRRLFVWAAVLTALFTAIYAWPHYIFALLTDDEPVRLAAMDYRWWCALLPVCGAAAFVWDGVFIGLTYTRGMLWAVAVADVFFFVLYFLLPASMGNHRLWLSFVIYLAMRGVVQTILYQQKNRLI